MEFKVSRLDRFIGLFSPQAMLERAHARYRTSLLLEHGARKYEGASRSKRLGGWKTDGASVNTDMLRDLGILRSRNRDLVKNNPYADSAVTGIATNMVGTGIVPSIKPRKKGGGDQKTEDSLKDLWRDWAESTAIDADGKLDIYGHQGLWATSIPQAGEIFVRRRWRRVSDGLPLPMQIQALEGDFCDHTLYRTEPNGNKIKQGIEFDALGRRVAYHFFREHPGEVYTGVGSREMVRVPAEDVIHILKVVSSGQIRGVPWGTSVIIKMHDLDEYQDATLLGQKLSAAHAAFVIDPQGATSPLLEASKSKLPEEISPNTITKLGPGEDVRFNNPSAPQNYADFNWVNLHAVAVGYKVPYELLTGDLKGVNFSSGRLGWRQFYRNIDVWRWQMMVPMGLNPLWVWFIQAATLVGVTRASEYYADWTPPAREYIDPTAESQATINEVRGGLKSLPEAIREQGRDPDQVLAETKEFNEKMDKMGIVYDSDARKITKSGIAQTAEGENPAINSEGEEK